MAKNSRKEKNSSKTRIDTFGKTILSNSTDTDIIECSIVGYENKYLPLCNSGVKANSLSLSIKKTVENSLRNSTESTKKKEVKNLNGSIRKSLRKFLGLDDDVVVISEMKSPIQTPSSESHSVLKRIISTCKKTPEGDFLSKSKLKNIQKWLVDNDVETVRTPPFANLSVTPRNSTKPKRKILDVSLKETNKENQRENSSIDSEVEDVLKAVYGDDWLKKNVQRTCKTEPKRKLIKTFTPLTEIKQTKLVRRNILKSTKSNAVVVGDEEMDLNGSGVSGIKIINLDDSVSSRGFIKSRRLNFRGREDSDADSSIESIFPTSTKKTKRKKAAPTEVENPSEKNSAVKTQTSGAVSKTPKKTFLASLSVSTPTSRCHPDAHQFKVNFKSKKEELVKKLYKLYNGEIFEGQLAEDMNFSWNIKLRGTAGYCYNKRITKSTGEVIRMSRIEFSTKIVDRADRLRDTMIHELCHAASWVINGVLDGHGQIWRSWAAKAMRRFPELPNIKRCHNYEIVSKYVYRCTSCGYSIKRHSKSINTERKRCGHCYGVLELLLNKKKKGKSEVPEYDTTRTLRTPNKFALFVKENYHSVKSIKGNAKHAEIMRTLSQQYALLKKDTKFDEG